MCQHPYGFISPLSCISESLSVDARTDLNLLGPASLPCSPPSPLPRLGWLPSVVVPSASPTIKRHFGGPQLRVPEEAERGADRTHTSGSSPACSKAASLCGEGRWLCAIFLDTHRGSPNSFLMVAREESAKTIPDWPFSSCLVSGDQASRAIEVCPGPGEAGSSPSCLPVSHP